MERPLNNFILKRNHISDLKKFKETDVVYAFPNINLIEVNIKPTLTNFYREKNHNIPVTDIPITNITAKNILILNLNHCNAYGHIYSEVFSELYAVDETYSDYDCILTIITPLMLKIIQFFNLKVSNKIQFINSDSEEKYLLNFEQLEIVNHRPQSYINKPKNVIKLKTAFHALKPITNTPKNFLVFCSRSSRTAGHGRNITKQNETEIIEYLKQYAIENNLEFYLLTGEEPDGSITSLSKQYELFSNAKIVVGLHGGVFSNLIFLDPLKNPKVIEFCPMVNKSFSLLFEGAIDTFAEYHHIPYIIPTEIESNGSRLNLLQRSRIKQNSLKHIDSTIDLSKLKELLVFGAHEK